MQAGRDADSERLYANASAEGTGADSASSRPEQGTAPPGKCSPFSASDHNRGDRAGKPVDKRLPKNILARWVVGHFRKHRTRKPWASCWRIGLESLIVGLVVAIILSFFVQSSRREIQDWPAYKLLLAALLISPAIETLLFQAVPIEIARRLKAGFGLQVLASMILFTLPHMLEGISVGTAAGLVGGFYLAFIYAHWRAKSLWTALWTTAVAHMIGNSLVLLTLITG